MRGKPWVDLRSNGDVITVLIEEPTSIRWRSGISGDRYVDAELTLDEAKALRDRLTERIAMVEGTQ